MHGAHLTPAFTQTRTKILLTQREEQEVVRVRGSVHLSWSTYDTISGSDNRLGVDLLDNEEKKGQVNT